MENKSKRKVGRNDPCPCGSGKKYKKCCMKKTDPVPVEVIKHFQKIRAEQEYLKQAGIHINYVKPIMFKGKKVFALGNKVYANCPSNTTFHTFLIQILKETIGLDWFREQAKLPNEKRHFISICLEKLGEWIEKNKRTAKRVNSEVWGAKPDGYSKSLLLLAFDVCSLIHKHKLPLSLLERLKSHDQYQGARYEIAIAAIFARLDCDIQFTDENSKSKHCEFIATHRATGSSLAVEAKSKHRSGVLHQIGFLSPLEKLLSARLIRRLFNDALEQNPKDVPFAVFIDVNSPITPSILIDDKPWVKDVKKLVNKKLSGVAPQEYPLNAAFFTNFSYHYQTENEAEQGEVTGIVIPHPKFPPPNPEFFGYLQGALNHYGFVPAIDIDQLFGSSDKD
jgi:hypothetical protein